MSFKLLALVPALLCAVVWGQDVADSGPPHPIGSSHFNPEEEKVAAFLVDAEEELRSIAEQHTFVEWSFESNINDETEKAKLEFQVQIFAKCHCFLSFQRPGF